MSTALTPKPLDPTIVAQVLLSGDLDKLNDQQRMAYCKNVCESLGLNPLTQPFAFIKLNGKLVMYAKKDATEQLRKLHGVSINSVTSQRVDDVFIVTATAVDRSGRTDASTGAVALGTLKGEALANALMKAETKAKRRVTLSICGLGILDETETETLPREPQYTVEAVKVEPKALEAMPDGTCRVMSVVPQRKGNFEWADVTYVTSQGEERQAVARRGFVALIEQFCQNGTVCEILTETNSKGKAEVTEAKAYHELVAPAPDASRPITEPVPF